MKEFDAFDDDPFEEPTPCGHCCRIVELQEMRKCSHCGDLCCRRCYLGDNCIENGA